MATSYGGAAGQNKALAYSGPHLAVRDEIPNTPPSATTVNFKEGVGTATGIKLYKAAATTLTATEGTIAGSVGFAVKAAAAIRLGWAEPAASRRYALEPLPVHMHRRRARQRRPLHRQGRP